MTTNYQAYAPSPEEMATLQSDAVTGTENVNPFERQWRDFISDVFPSGWTSRRSYFTKTWEGWSVVFVLTSASTYATNITKVDTDLELPTDLLFSELYVAMFNSFRLIMKASIGTEDPAKLEACREWFNNKKKVIHGK